MPAYDNEKTASRSACGFFMPNSFLDLPLCKQEYSSPIDSSIPPSCEQYSHYLSPTSSFKAIADLTANRSCVPSVASGKAERGSGLPIVAD